MSDNQNRECVNEINNAFKNIKNIIDANSVIGDIVQLTSNVVIVPICKIRMGIISGEISDNSKKSKKGMSNGGGGSGINISPVGFIVVVGSDVRYINANTENDSVNRVIDTISNLCSEFLRSTSNDKK